MDLTFHYEHPVGGRWRKLVGVADGETASRANDRAVAVALTVGKDTMPRLLRCSREVPEPSRDVVDIRGKAWLKDDWFHWGVLLPSYYELLSRVRTKRDGVAFTAGIGLEPPLWRILRIDGRWPEWSIFAIDERSHSPARALTVVKGDTDHVRIELLEMGSPATQPSPHEKAELRRIRSELKR